MAARARSETAPKAVAARIVVPEFKFVIVIPGGDDAVLQKLLAHVSLPPLARLRMGEIEIRSLPAPEGDNFRRIESACLMNPPKAATSA
jgi:hypothetical protein